MWSRRRCATCMLNPLTPLFELARLWVIDPTRPVPSRRRAAGRSSSPIAIYLAVCVLAVWVFSREAPLIAEQL